MPRPKLPAGEAASATVGVRLSPHDRALLVALVTAEQTEINTRGLSATVTEADVIRGLIRRTARDRGVRVESTDGISSSTSSTSTSSTISTSTSSPTPTPPAASVAPLSARSAELANRIKRWLDVEQTSKADLAKRAGVPHQDVSRLLSGGRLPDEKLQLLAAVVGS